MFSLTIFKNRFDNTTNKRLDFDTWDHFSNLLYNLSAEAIESKDKAHLISPACYEANTKRSNANVTSWGCWAAVDVDNHVFGGDLQNELHKLYGNYEYICYSTASSTNDHPKFRLVFPLRRALLSSEIKKFWYALNTELGSIGDTQTKDLSRMYYIPATYAGANNFIFSNTGSCIDPSQLMSKHPFTGVDKAKSFMDRLPPELQEQVIAHRKSKAQNVMYTWSSYRNCPFIPKTLIAEYQTINESGWYRKMYQIMVATAVKAVRKSYPITSAELETLMRELDMDTGRWYENRPINVEAENAIEFAYRKA